MNNCLDCGDLIDDRNYKMTCNGYISPRCLSCLKIKRAKTVAKSNAKRTKGDIIKSMYDISIEQYHEILEGQNHLCAICHLPEVAGRSLSIDHDHDTNKVRGLLCQKCNVAIGMLKEDENIIWNMLEYLKKYKWSIAA